MDISPEGETELLTETEVDADGKGLSDFTTLMVNKPEGDGAGEIDALADEETDELTELDANGEFVNCAEGESESFALLVILGV